VLVFTGMAAMVKYLSDTIETGQIVFYRSFVGLVPLLVWMLARGEFPTALRTTRHGGHLWRAAIGTAAMATYFLALARLPLPDVTAIIYASPLITLMLATVLLGEKVGIHRWSAVAVGLAGVLLVLWPHLGADGGPSSGDAAATGAVLALITAACMALVMIQLRKLTRTETTAAVVFYFSVYASLLALFTLPFGWTVPTRGEFVLLVAMGLAGGVGQILLTQSYRYAPAAVVAPFEYTTMLWALLLGFVVFGDVPTAIMLSGAAVVIAAGLYVIHRERQLGIADARPPRSGSAT
jgi:drug/metabolite transporter (DMT)-like permease